MSGRDERDLARLGALGRELDGEVLSSVDVLEQRRLIAALERPPRRRVSWRMPALAVVAVAAAIVALVFWPASSLDYEVRGATAERGFVEATEDATVAFSDGTTAVLRQGSMGRVVEVTEHGARIHLEHGTAELSVVPKARAAWTVGAGPYQVHVKGTRFTVQWSPAERRFSVALAEGAVVVEGPLLDGGLELRPGQTLSATPGDLRVRESAPQAGNREGGAGPHDRPEDVEAPEAVTTASASAGAAAASNRPPRASWSQLLAEGKHDEVMRLARARGIGTVLSSGTPGELTAMGDAARYTGDGATARKALEQLRARFPGHPAATTAAFLLGRMSEGSPGKAMRLYDLYLSESPGGAYAPEAEGRKLVLSQGSPAGVALARAYLRKYPKGPYAPLARQLTSTRKRDLPSAP